MAKKPQHHKTQSALIDFLRSLDNQVAREMQKAPADRREGGALKWEPYQKRVELTTSMLLESLATEEIQLDSLLISYQSFSKALLMYIEELGPEGLGRIRTEYCRKALSEAALDLNRAEHEVNDRKELN